MRNRHLISLYLLIAFFIDDREVRQGLSSRQLNVTWDTPQRKITHVVVPNRFVFRYMGLETRDITSIKIEGRNLLLNYFEKDLLVNWNSAKADRISIFVSKNSQSQRM